MSDPKHPQPGAPWYITKPCSVAHNPNNVHYCLQAKGAFASTCIMLVIFLCQLILAVYSCFPTKQHKQEHAEKRDAQRARDAMLEESSSPEDYHWPKTAFDIKTPVPRTPSSTGGIKSPPLNPMTPRTLAFNKLGGTKDLPLRSHFSTPNAPKSPTYAMQSPEFARTASPLSPGFERARMAAEEEQERDRVAEVSASAMYFPPPPKIATK